MPLEFTESANNAFGEALGLANAMRHECVTPEHFLAAFLKQRPFVEALSMCNLNADILKEIIGRYLSTNMMESVPKDVEYNVGLSVLLQEMITLACASLKDTGNKVLDIPRLVRSFLKLRKSVAADMLRNMLGGKQDEFLNALQQQYAGDKTARIVGGHAHVKIDAIDMGAMGEGMMGPNQAPQDWTRFARKMEVDEDITSPIVGRVEELNRMCHILSRRDKNCLMLIGEPGVGKTMMIKALLAAIHENMVPTRLEKCPIFELDVAMLYSNAQFRGEMEKVLRMVLDQVKEEAHLASSSTARREVKVTPIVFIDDIHHFVGASRSPEASMDASHLLKPYIDNDEIRFIGTTTFEEYNRYVLKNKSLARRFQQVEIKEPTIDEAVEICMGVKSCYESYHRVSFSEEVVRKAVELSAKYVNDRFLPEKAIDLLDEAATQAEMASSNQRTTRAKVTMKILESALSKVSKFDAMAMKADDAKHLATLEARIQSQIFGQDEAVQRLVEAVQMAKSGLMDDGKPIASMLFVGPTGVGKTEVAKVLAKELGISLVRFDMSEYTEKHTVAKLIGSPAGYIGYDDGGLLTDAIRKTPHCVLLLDEIEKAHSDIYNILLQVMDYAQLTDNKGNKADFRNVILLMTSNAGAQHARKANVGFASSVTTGDAMVKQVKQIFKPEFINRLSSTVVFHDMTKEMAQMILDKKLKQFQEKLDAKHVQLELTDAAYTWLLEKGFTPEYGAREMDRVVAQYLKPLLMKAILFGKLKKGGEALVDAQNDALMIAAN
jgi:ATP-dependent Clp protease ATP-binding subunit ClpA